MQESEPPPITIKPDWDNAPGKLKRDWERSVFRLHQVKKYRNTGWRRKAGERCFSKMRELRKHYDSRQRYKYAGDEFRRYKMV